MRVPVLVRASRQNVKGIANEIELATEVHESNSKVRAGYARLGYSSRVNPTISPSCPLGGDWRLLRVEITR